jgi:hypothetical protein
MLRPSLPGRQPPFHFAFARVSEGLYKGKGKGNGDSDSKVNGNRVVRARGMGQSNSRRGLG